MVTELGIIWAIIEILLGGQMLYYAFAPVSKIYVIIVILYWLWLGLYVWNPSNIFRTKK